MKKEKITYDNSKSRADLLYDRSKLVSKAMNRIYSDKRKIDQLNDPIDIEGYTYAKK